MSKPELPAIRFHEDIDLFRESVRFTAAETAFTVRLIEKDYFCTVLLAYLAAAAGDAIVFKGGTCLAKIHADLYRLSEDLDFTIPISVEAPRTERSKRAAAARAALVALPKRLPSFRVLESLKGSNNSTQYFAVVGYASMVSGQQETVKIEVGLREPLLEAAVRGSARTLLLDPVSGNPLVPPVIVRSISKSEVLAEKFRAAMTRREVAIRDFYDIDYLVRRAGLFTVAIDLVEQVKQKLAVPRNDPIDVSAGRLTDLRRQLESHLRPVLRDQDFREFDLDSAFGMVEQMAEAVG